MTRAASQENITDRLRADVLSGDFEPGARLIESQLTERYGAGRAAIRAAILELDKEGLVAREANRGATVRAYSLDEAIEVYEVRARLEGLIARSAAEKASESDRQALRELIPGLRDALGRSEEREYRELGRALHEQIGRIAGHRTARELSATLRNRSAHHPDRLSSVPGRAAQSLEEHIQIIEAIANGSPDLAEDAARRHIESIIAALR